MMEGPVVAEDCPETFRLPLAKNTELMIVAASRSIENVALEFDIVTVGLPKFI